MDYRIVEKEAFRVVGKGITVSFKDGGNFRRVNQFWNDSERDGTVMQICSHIGPMGMLGICMEMDQTREEFTYMIAVEKPKAGQVADLEEKEIPASKWAVFEAIGPMPGAIQDVWKRIFSEWFPATGYEHAEAPELEVYPPGPKSTTDPDYRSEIWIPIIKE